MGKADLVSHPVLRMPLVLKLFKSTTAGADEFAEAHLASRIVSPHVVSVINAGYEKGTPFIIPLLEG